MIGQACEQWGEVRNRNLRSVPRARYADQNVVPRTALRCPPRVRFKKPAEPCRADDVLRINGRRRFWQFVLARRQRVLGAVTAFAVVPEPRSQDPILGFQVGHLPGQFLLCDRGEQRKQRMEQSHGGIPGTLKKRWFRGVDGLLGPRWDGPEYRISAVPEPDARPMEKYRRINFGSWKQTLSDRKSLGPHNPEGLGKKLRPVSQNRVSV